MRAYPARYVRTCVGGHKVRHVLHAAHLASEIPTATARVPFNLIPTSPEALARPSGHPVEYVRSLPAASNDKTCSIKVQHFSLPTRSLFVHYRAIFQTEHVRQPPGPMKGLSPFTRDFSRLPSALSLSRPTACEVCPLPSIATVYKDVVGRLFRLGQSSRRIKM